MKICISCKKEKSLTDFHKNNKMKDGHLGRCRECCRSWSKAYLKTEQGKKVRQRSRKTWRNKHPEKKKVHKLLENAVKRGELEKPDHCELCDESTQWSGHHHDYSWPLLVTWVCIICHKLLHRKDI